MSGRPPAPAPLPIAVVDNHTHLDIARDDGPAPARVDGRSPRLHAGAHRCQAHAQPAGSGSTSPASRPSSSSTTEGSSLVKIGDGLATGVPALTGRDCQDGVWL